MNTRIALSCLFVLALGFSDHTCYGLPPENAAADETFVAWAKEHTVAIPAIDTEKVDPALGRMLDKLIEGKRIVFLGEPDHFIREKYDYRLMLIRHLRTRGFTHIGMEMGLADGKRIDRYLTSGDEAHLATAALLGYKGDLRTDRGGGNSAYTDESNPAFRKVVRGEMRWFYAQLRKLNAGRRDGERPLRWFGFDTSMKPGGGYVDAAAILEPHAEQAEIAKLTAMLQLVPEESPKEEIERLDRCAKFVEEHRKSLLGVLGDVAMFNLSQTIDNLAESFRVVDAIQLPPSDPNRMAGLARREQVMCRRLDELLARLPKDEKIILLGHNLHLSKDSTTIKFGTTPMWPSLGTHLSKKMPNEVLAIWLLYDHGMHGSIQHTPPARSIAAAAEMVEHTLARVGAAYLLPLPHTGPAAEWLNEERTLLMGGLVTQTRLSRQADVVFFITEVSEPRIRE